MATMETYDNYDHNYEVRRRWEAERSFGGRPFHIRYLTGWLLAYDHAFLLVSASHRASFPSPVTPNE